MSESPLAQSADDGGTSSDFYDKTNTPTPEMGSPNHLNRVFVCRDRENPAKKSRHEPGVDPSRASSSHFPEPFSPHRLKRKAESNDQDAPEKKFQVSPPFGSLRKPNQSRGYSGAAHPEARKNADHPVPGSYSRPQSVVSAAGFPTPSASANILHNDNEVAAKVRQEERRKEIERRASVELSIPPHVLKQMPAYHAAIKIAMNLNDPSWEALKAKLIIEAEQAEKDAAANQEEIDKLTAQTAEVATLNSAQPPSASTDDAQHVSTKSESDDDEEGQSDSSNAQVTASQQDQAPRRSLKEVKEVELMAWAAAQEPVRSVIGPLADEIINRDWDGGKSVSIKNDSEFAIDVLTKVHAGYARLTKPPGTLVLDAMKWVYEQKLKEFAEKYRKDIFFCPMCDSGLKAFEGCIQHYAAKHTNAFSRGSIVVAWHSALWPESLPFSTDKWRFHSPNRPQPASSHTYHQPQPIHPLQNQAGPFAGYRQPSPYLHHQDYYRPAGYMTQAPFPASPPNPHLPYPPPPQYGPVPQYPGWSAPPYSQSPPSYGYAFPPPVPQYYPPNASSSSHYTPGHIVPPPPTPNRPSLNEQTEYFVREFDGLFNYLKEFKNVQPSVRLFTVLFHTGAHFFARFYTELSMDTVGHVIMQGRLSELSKENNLGCKSCADQEPGPEGVEVSRRVYNFNALLQHYQNYHVPADIAKKENWKTEMIELPDARVVDKILSDERMSDDAHRLIREAFANVFHKVGESQNTTRSASSSTDRPTIEYDPHYPRIQDRPNARQSHASNAHQPPYQVHPQYSQQFVMSERQTSHLLEDPNGEVYKLFDPRRSGPVSLPANAVFRMKGEYENEPPYRGAIHPPVQGRYWQQPGTQATKRDDYGVGPGGRYSPIDTDSLHPLDTHRPYTNQSEAKKIKSDNFGHEQRHHAAGNPSRGKRP